MRITINRVVDNYECETIQDVLMSNILDRIFEYYNKIFLVNL
ncbi:Hypothetical protein BCO_0900148 (plasmid) [Borrelia coriaceae ATCC 43381]|uniref:Uncharacterized protein n=1 Tax=Borrelia coriaceae ATCC 43381 TaxID=1408429 RepID=W5SXI0_9SPIR|nr:Hypothetical protein BCO_0900148 [Borrelia coriaceae ATCC 43381]